MKELKTRPGLSVDDLTIGQILRRNKHLDDEQKAAIRTLLTGPGAIKMLTGVAGSGKTTVLRAVTAALESAGYRVVGASLTGIAKEELVVKAGMKARTVASYLRNFDKPLSKRVWERGSHVVRQFYRAARKKKTWTKQAIVADAKTVHIIDEVGMLGTRELARYVREITKNGGHVVFAGDDKQMQSFEAGGAMRLLAKKVPHSHLSTNRRQLDEEDRLAVQAIREGKATEAIKSYFDRGRVEVGDSKSDAIDLLVQSWKSLGGAKRPEDFAIFTQTRAEAKEINRRCQQVRLAAATTPHLTSVSNGEERFFRGDRVLFTKPNRKHSGIENGHRGTIMRIDPIRGEATVRLDHEPKLLHPKETPAEIVTIPVRKFGDAIALGYAVTTNKGQSQTVKHALLLMGGDLLDQHLAYTQVSRARESTRIFIDKSHAGEQWKDLIAAVERSAPKKRLLTSTPIAQHESRSGSVSLTRDRHWKGNDDHTTQSYSRRSSDRDRPVRTGLRHRDRCFLSRFADSCCDGSHLADPSPHNAAWRTHRRNLSEDLASLARVSIRPGACRSALVALARGSLPHRDPANSRPNCANRRSGPSCRKGTLGRTEVGEA